MQDRSSSTASDSRWSCKHHQQQQQQQRCYTQQLQQCSLQHLLRLCPDAK
jgi:hypothetical protein